MIWPPLASYPLASRNPLNPSNSSSINPASVNRWRNSHTVVESGTSAVGLSPKNRRNEPLSWVWYSSSSSLRFYSCWRINSLNSNNTLMGLRPALLFRSALGSRSRMLRNISHGVIRLISLNQSLRDSSFSRRFLILPKPLGFILFHPLAQPRGHYTDAGWAISSIVRLSIFRGAHKILQIL
jgi:hypothetical protein